MIRRLELHEANKVRTLTLGNLDLSPSPDPGLFTFDVPAGARSWAPPPSGAEGHP